MLRGVEKVVGAVRPTLGPFPRLVAVAPTMPGRSPELLDDGGIIARRIIQLPDRDEDIGAMYLRHLLWRVREDCGDGTATTAVLFDEILQQGVRHIVQGGSAMRLRAFLEKGARLVHLEMGKMTQQVSDNGSVARIAESICYDPAMANLLGEVFELIGPYGHFELRSGQGRGLEYESVLGVYWESRLLSKTMINVPGEGKAVLAEAAVLVTDFAIDDPHHLVHMITEAKKAGKSNLVLICNSINDTCVGFLNAESTRKVLHVIAVKTPASRLDEQIAAVQDISILTGASPLTLHAGETLMDVKGEHFGQARSIWANDQFFGIVSGKGNPHKIREHYWSLKSQYARLEFGEARTMMRNRIGKLLGGAVVLHVGGATETEINVRKDLAERSVESIRGALIDGVLPGGGMAFLACRPALKQAQQQAQDPDEVAAYRILFNAMDLPLRTMAENAGLRPDEVMAELKHSGPGFGYDIRRQQVIPMAQGDILDPAHVVQLAAYRSIVGAALLLTVDVLVHHKNPKIVADT